ncbi:MAG: ABC transporter permease [Alphaproteobacteria bacterium]|jgi:peptide/nickel transport system permease protein|nr:ABC transporter permease [Alphaproteobacteria bacterium]MBT4085638.1 ABC transporter permease [Alphaproteobacteria bacterium]MBT4544485.1 ABC transporter permease [Alphaproteobacteria bacterium]MBT7746260.1 ABC transporter permease [Alphaproteobacteria bacterium]
MSVFLAKRFLTFVATLLGASIVVFLVLEILPGDPSMTLLGADADEEAYAALRLKLGLDDPAFVRYFEWMWGMFHGDFGVSYAYSVPVMELVWGSLGLTVPLAMFAMAITVVVALGLGVFAASRHNKPGDYVIMTISQLGIAVPNFWFGILLILFFAVNLGWFKAGGFIQWEDGIWLALKSLFLPAIALATVQAAILARTTRSAVLETFREDYVRTARAKGLTRSQTLWRHVLRNALIPVITVMGLQFANLLAGTIVIESVFSLPGLGKLVFQAIANRDMPVVKDIVLLLAGMVIVVNFIVDVTYAVIDPRLKVHDV